MRWGGDAAPEHQNLQAIPKLVQGLTVEQVEEKLSGISCSGRPLPGDELLRAGTLGRVSRLDAAFPLVWLVAALFRGCFLVRVLRELLCRPEEPEKGVPE